ncbi:hypothetical protein Nepgr_006109 [Nepenthes gracilis]|uniref:Uncharacterized protein n=1 Tax=Nepenthes gracilis TaxID=150966 RepID=A0AAD3S4J3_NEPGR|nr:hypothetical protein Nepgr_006109 [Nepenthes gracilis]
MNTPVGLHSMFFSSLKQVEKRLKLEKLSCSISPPSPCPFLSSSPPPLLPIEIDCVSTESLSSSIHLHVDDQPNKSTSLQDSEPPSEFLSNSCEFLPSHEDPLSQTHQSLPGIIDQFENDIDDIDLLMQLLGMPDFKEGKSNQCTDDDCENCYCCGGFYEKIVGMKAPKCGKEVQRLEGWIRYFGSCGGKEKEEPLRLAHLLLGKASFLSRSDGGFEGLQFPSTVEEFLQNDPPPD